MTTKNYSFLVIAGMMFLIIISLFILLKGGKKNQNSTNPPQRPVIAATVRIVTLTDDGFSPQEMTINPGDSISWVNGTNNSATVNSDDHPSHEKYSFLNLGNFESESTVQTQFTETGVYTYHNHLKPEQKGIIIVK